VLSLPAASPYLARMSTARCAASVPLAGNDAPRSSPLSPQAWSALTRLRPDVFVDGWLREATVTHLVDAGLDRFAVTAVYVRVNGWFERRTWWLTPQEMQAVLDASSES